MRPTGWTPAVRSVAGFWYLSISVCPVGPGPSRPGDGPDSVRGRRFTRHSAGCRRLYRWLLPRLSVEPATEGPPLSSGARTGQTDQAEETAVRLEHRDAHTLYVAYADRVTCNKGQEKVRRRLNIVHIWCSATGVHQPPLQLKVKRHSLPFLVVATLEYGGGTSLCRRLAPTGSAYTGTEHRGRREGPAS